MTSTEHSRRKYLQAMGFDQWLRRDAGAECLVQAADHIQTNDLPSRVPAKVTETGVDNSLANDRKATVACNKTRSLQYGTDSEVQGNKDNAIEQLDKTEILSMDWSGLESQVSQCRVCELYQRRTQAVFGAGNKQAEWLIIGEAPGEQEDLKGDPFVGRAGVLLNNLLLAMGLKREQVYITNIVKCRPPGNRDPHVDEAAACHSYLQRQIDLISPAIILVVGRIAAQSLLQSSEPVIKMRGRVHQLSATEIPLIVTYHPAYLLRKPTEKAKVWEDLKFAMSQINSKR